MPTPLRRFVLFIIGIAVFLRFANFSDRWGLGYDQASFAIIGKHALNTFSIPLLGPFSSGGPFQTGGLWYWAVSTGNIFFPQVIEGPWLFMGILSVATVWAIILAGTLLGGVRLGVIAGLLAAVSTAQITQSTNLSNQTPIALPAALSIISTLAYIRSGRIVYLLFLGLSIGAASAVHLQGMGLLPLALMALLGGRRPTLRGVLLVILGLMLPWLPVLYADMHHDWYNVSNMIRYYTVDQYTISFDVLGRRWKTFLLDFLPSLWGFVIGGHRMAGLLIIATGALLGPYLFLQKRLSRLWIVLIGGFLGMICIVRYARVPLFESFVVFLHPFILLITAGIILALMRVKHQIGIFLLLALLIPTLIKDSEEITRATNRTARTALAMRSALVTRFPGETFAVYDNQFQTAATTLPLLLYLEQKRLLDPNGRRVGLSMPTEEILLAHQPLATGENGAMLFDLQGSSAALLDSSHWAYLDFPILYESVQQWWRKR